MTKRLGLTALLALWLLSGCAGMKPEDYADTTPRFDVMSYFLGESRAWGIFQDRSGQVRRQFTVDIDSHGVRVLIEGGGKGIVDHGNHLAFSGKGPDFAEIDDA